MKLLSVAIPCYNSEAYMRHCIDTLLTGGDEVEILIVDDGSRTVPLRLPMNMKKIIRASARLSIRKMADMARQSTQDSGMPRAFIIRS